MKRFLIITFLLIASLACSRLYPSPATETPVPATPTSTLEPATQTPEATPTTVTDSLSQLEVITAGNWSRLQLLKTFPAEMPLNHSAVAISPDGKTMAVGSSEGVQIFFFDIESRQLSQTISMGITNVGAYFNIRRMEYLPDGTLMVNSEGPYEIYHIDTAGNVLSMWDGIGFSLSADKKVMVHSPNAGLILEDIASNTSLVSLDDMDSSDFSLSPDGSKIAVEDIGLDNIRTTIWDISSKTILTTLDETAIPRFSPDGKFLAVTKYDYEHNRTPLKIFSPDGANEITTLDVNIANGVGNFPSVWSLDSSILIAQIASGSPVPVAWDTTNWQLLDAPALQGRLDSLSPDGRILITRTADGGILLWGVSSK